MSEMDVTPKLTINFWRALLTPRNKLTVVVVWALASRIIFLKDAEQVLLIQTHLKGS